MQIYCPKCESPNVEDALTCVACGWRLQMPPESSREAATPQFLGEEPLRLLVDIAAKLHLAELFYRKGVTRTNIIRRVVEPYSVTQGKQDVMVRCYQLEPEEGWRFFMIHKLDRVADTGVAFSPRRRITLPMVHVEQSFEKKPAWTSAVKMYRNMVSDALADGVLTREEVRDIEAFKQESGISIGQVRFVHASLFYRCLGAVLDDGLVDEDERDQIRFLHRVLSKLGWTVAE